MKTAIALSHGHSAKWLQVVMKSLKMHTNNVEADIFVACTWPGHPTIKAITENDLAMDVNIIDCQKRLQSHATGLDEILDYLLEHGGYSHMFCAETDAMACQDNWLDWFHGQIGDAGMAGFFWQEGMNHYNINPSGTLYRIDMLEAYHREARGNDEGMFWHPNGNRSDTEDGMDSNIKDVVGAFAETRGIKDPTEQQRDAILKGVPQAAWFEPGSWLYYRSLGEWGNVEVPCDHIYTQFGPVNSPEGTYYGGKNDPQYIHFWGGTRAYDFLKHPVNDGFVSGGAPYWLEREDKIWKNVVPEGYRAAVKDIYEEMDYERLLKENLPNAEKVIELVPMP